MGSKEKTRSKKASQGRKKKRDRSRSRKRSSKKLLHHEDSYCALSSASSSSCSSEEGVKRKRSRSRAMKHDKGRKRRARSRSCSSDGSSDSPRVKKRKSSKRKVDLGQKKKASKKYRRAASLSSTNSDGTEKRTGGSKKKEMHRRYDKEDKSKRERKRCKSPSLSSSSKSGASDSERKRYRSPSHSSLSMSSKSERERKRKRYWSPSGSSMSRSIAGSDQHVRDEIEIQNKPIRKLNSIIVVATEPDQNTMSKGDQDDLDMRDDERRTKSNIVGQGEHTEEEKNGTEAMVPVLGTEDLESILRLKALENLKKFRGGSKMAAKSNKMDKSVTEVKQLPNSDNAADLDNIGGGNMKQSLSSAIKPIQNESDEYHGLNVNDSSKVVDLATSPEKEEVLGSPSGNTSFKNHIETKTGGTASVQHSEDNGVMVPEATLIVDNLKPPPIADMKFNGGAGSASRLLATLSTKDLKSSPQDCFNATVVSSKCSSDKSGSTPADEDIPKSVGNSNKESNTVNATVPDNPSSSLPTTVSGEHVCPKHQGEAEEGSQFQEKTMSVMRGGELVQVSYKVYIPKKTPAVARRRLKR